MKNLKVLRRIIYTKLRYNVRTSELFSLVLMIAGILILPLHRATSANLLMRSHRNTANVDRQIRLERILKRHHLLDRCIIESLIPGEFFLKDFYPGRVFKLKEKQNHEKGVLLLKFTEMFSKLRQRCDIDRIMEDYYLVLEPSYAGYCTPEIFQFLEYTPSPAVVQATEKLDEEFLKRLNSNLVVLQMGASDWVNDRLFRPNYNTSCI